MDLREFKAHVDARFDKLEEKIDTGNDRGIKNETDVSWLKGGVSFLSVILLSVLAYLANAFFGHR